jgi:hypothetical protein
MGFFRMLVFSPKRYCFACRRKWQVKTWVSRLGDWLARPTVLVVGLCLAVGLVLAIVTSMDFDPVRWAKTFVRSRYDQKYGKDSKNRLWLDLGALYGSHGAASDDYINHKKKSP